MNKNIKNNDLISINKDGFFFKIKQFFQTLFYKDKKILGNIKEENKDINLKKDNDKENFLTSIKNIGAEENKILKLQQQYRKGIIKEEDLSNNELESLYKLYDEQIVRIRRSNEIKINKIIRSRKKE